jgi:hypothetical protein
MSWDTDKAKRLIEAYREKSILWQRQSEEVEAMGGISHEV